MACSVRGGSLPLIPHKLEPWREQGSRSRAASVSPGGPWAGGCGRHLCSPPPPCGVPHSSLSLVFPRGAGLLLDVCFWSRETKMRNKPKNLEIGPPFAGLGTRQTARPCPRGPGALSSNSPHSACPWQTRKPLRRGPRSSRERAGRKALWDGREASAGRTDGSRVPPRDRRAPAGGTSWVTEPGSVASCVLGSLPCPTRSARLL